MNTEADTPRRSGEAAVTPVPLFDLTDEELMLLCGQDQSVIALPHMQTLSEPARQQALRTAWRSMLASGLVELEDGPHADPQAARTSPDLVAVLDVRGGAPVMLCLQRTLSEQTVLRYVHLVDDSCLVEDVLSEGVHRFGWLARDDLAAGIQAFLVPAGAVPGSGDPVVLDAAWGRDAGAGEPGAVTDAGAVDTGAAAALLQALGDPVVMADATVRYDGDQGPGPLLGITIGARGCWVSRNVPGTPGQLRLDPVAPEAIGDLVTELVQAAEERVQATLRS